MYSRDSGGQTLLFGNTSALFESDLVMFDHQTGSYWFQVLGEAIVGQLTGSRLTPLPAVTVPWGEWRSSYPDTRLLVADGEEPFGLQFSRDPFGVTYPDRLDRGNFSFPVSEEKLDYRLKGGDVVITVEVGPAAKAYPLELMGDGVVNDEVAGVPMVVSSEGATASAFRSEASGQRLTFRRDEGGAGRVRMVDAETGSLWDRAGRAIEGPLAGTALEPMPSRRGFWFSIAGALPGIQLHSP